MARAASTLDYPVEVEGVGTFIFGRRTLKDELRIQAEYSRITEGVDTPTLMLYTLGIAIATIRILMVQGPVDFDLDALDPVEEDTFTQLQAIYEGVKAKEYSFRKKSGKGSKADSTPDVEVDGVLVPTEVQPSAN